MKGIFLLLWMILTSYSLFFTRHLSGDLSILFSMTNVEGIKANLLLFTVFNLMGLWPFLFAREIFARGTTKLYSVLLWFMSFALGAFAILLLLISLPKDGPLNLKRVKRLVKSKLYLGFILLSTFSLIVLGLLFGELSPYLSLFTTNRFVHIMTLDFLVLCIAFISLKVWKRTD